MTRDKRHATQLLHSSLLIFHCRLWRFASQLAALTACGRGNVPVARDKCPRRLIEYNRLLSTAIEREGQRPRCLNREGQRPRCPQRNRLAALPPRHSLLHEVPKLSTLTTPNQLSTLTTPNQLNTLTTPNQLNTLSLLPTAYSPAFFACSIA